MAKFKYLIRIQWSKADQCYIADIPDLKGVAGHGRTQKTSFEIRKERRETLDGMR